MMSNQECVNGMQERKVNLIELLKEIFSFYFEGEEMYNFFYFWETWSIDWNTLNFAKTRT